MLVSTKCSCASYNGGGVGTPERVVRVPDNIRKDTDGRVTVCLDECVADVILELWKRGLPTLNCCCGHGEESPSVVVPSKSELRPYMDVIKEVDTREWVILRWESVLMRHSFEDIEWG